MELKVLDYEFCVCKVEDFSKVDLDDEFCFIGITDEEKSVVCKMDKIPTNTIVEDKGWKAFRIQGILDFSLVGILSKIASILANHQISIFAISTFNTDYVLIKKESFDKALLTLSKEGYTIL